MGVNSKNYPSGSRRPRRDGNGNADGGVNTIGSDLSLANYYTVEELEALSWEDLRRLYGQIPTYRQKYYRGMYDIQKQQGGVTTDQTEFELLAHLLAQYRDKQMVPYAEKWFKVGEHITKAVEAGGAVNAEDRLVATPGLSGRNLVMIVVGALVMLGMLGTMLFGGGDDQADAQADTVMVVDGATVTPTPRRSPTPTPIALEEQDKIIEDGDLQRGLFPVGLQVYPFNERQPRVFVIQGKEVEMAEWKFEPNPDVGNYIIGLDVQPVVGIPWSEENQALFDSLGEGARFDLRMNTGAVRTYIFDRKHEVQRSDTAAFRQVSVGLVLVLLGERDRRESPTATRTLIVARYVPEQELVREGYLAEGADLPPAATATPLIPTVTPPPARDLLHVELVKAERQDQVLLTQLRLYNGQFEAVTITAEDVALALGYAPQPPGPWQTASGLTMQTILPGQALDVKLYWSWQGEPYASLRVGRYQFALELGS